MPAGSPRPLARGLLRVAFGTPDVPDRDLLARFVASRDEEAFAEIVRRHGPMVLAVCRRVTGRQHDAEDAFQAAFLVLARRAGHVGKPELLANWMYGVAYRTALEARAARRRAEEHAVTDASEPAAPEPPDDVTELRRVIDEELAKLPEKYRTAVVLCELEGLPRAAAAARMGIPEGTLSSRLAHARKVLAERLTRRGVTATATGIAAALGRDCAATAVPHSLTRTTVLAAARFAGGVTPPAVSPAVSSLTDGVLKAMLFTRLKHLFAAGLLACGLIGVGGALAQQLGAPAPADPGGHLAAPVGDPFAAADEPNKPEPKKVKARGIEDEDVPYGTFPSQAVVRLEDGKLIVRQRVHSHEPVKHTAGGATVVTYQQVSNVHASEYDPADIAVFDMKGNRLSPKAWKELFKSDVHVLVSNEGRLPNPRELTLFKQDALLVVLPSTIFPGYTPPPVGGRDCYVPAPVVQPARPAQGGIAPRATRPSTATPPPARPSVFIPSEPGRPAPTPVAPPTTEAPAVDELPPLRPLEVPTNRS